MNAALISHNALNPSDWKLPGRFLFVFCVYQFVNLPICFQNQSQTPNWLAVIVEFSAFTRLCFTRSRFDRKKSGLGMLTTSHVIHTMPQCNKTHLESHELMPVPIDSELNGKIVGKKRIANREPGREDNWNKHRWRCVLVWNCDCANSFCVSQCLAWSCCWQMQICPIFFQPSHNHCAGFFPTECELCSPWWTTIDGCVSARKNH